MIREPGYGIPQMMNHFPQMRILDHEQRHRHCNRIRFFIFQSFILCIHLFPMTGFRRMFSFLLIFQWNGATAHPMETD